MGKINAYAWPHGGAIICLEKNCPHNKQCANHSSAGDYRSEGGPAPKLTIENGVVFCQSIDEKTDDGSMVCVKLGTVNIKEFPKGTEIPGSFEMHLQEGCAACQPPPKIKITICVWAGEGSTKLESIGYSHKQEITTTDPDEVFKIAKKIFDADLNVMVYHNRLEGGVILFVDTKRFSVR